MKAFFKWFAGFFEDQQGYASRKSAAGYWGLIAMTYMIFKSVNGAEVDMEMFLMVLSFTGGMYGLILLERFAKQPPTKDPSVSPTGDKVSMP